MAKVLGSSRPQMIMGRLRVACWIPKATETHSFVILIAFPLKQFFQERAT